MKTKPPTSFRLSDEARRLLALLAEKLSISHTAILELAIREKARREGMK
jgi:predicted transcriptional regulator